MSVEQILQVVHSALGYTPEELRQKSRVRSVVNARILTAMLLWETGLKPEAICQIVNVNRTVIYHYLSRFDDHIYYDQEFKKQYWACMALINNIEDNDNKTYATAS